MENLIYHRAQPEDFTSVAELIVSQNQNPETHCIHSDMGDQIDAHEREIANLDQIGEIVFVIASHEAKLMGAMGCEFDRELGWGWLRGPFVTLSDPDWKIVAQSLFRSLKDALPVEIQRFNTFLDIANVRGNEFYQELGFEQRSLTHVYNITVPQSPFEPGRNCEHLTPEWQNDFVALHQTIFPKTYATGQQMIEKIGEKQQVFVSIQDGLLMGYINVLIAEESGFGSVEFVGVREEARGKGVGRQLLQSALHWLFDEKGVAEATLVVSDALTNARSLYESVGFKLLYTGMNQIKQIG